MKKFVFVAALALAGVCSAQNPSPSGQSGLQLGQGFDLTLPQDSARSGTSLSSPAPASRSAAQTTPAQSSSSPATSDAKSTGSLSYVEGSIWVLTFVKTKAGMSDDYFNSISASLKPVYEEEKRKKMILNYKILSADPGDNPDFNVIIMVEYPSTTAVEGSRDRIEPILDKIIGPNSSRRELATKRQDVREILGTKMMREIWLK
jgi:hypothetical protein